MATEGRGNPAARELGYCPCCGYRTLDPGPPGSAADCPVCGWWDDAGQFDDATCTQGSNEVSLATARENFESVGAVEPDLADAVRDPDAGEPHDPNWPYE